MNRVTAYARSVLDGRIVAGRLVRLACERHLADLRDGKRRGLKFDASRAEHAMRFVEALELADGEHAGKRFALSDWQAFIIGSLFGWVTREGVRRYRTAYVEVGKGNGKTPLAAAIGLYMMTAGGKPGCECYSAAVGRDQASICFRDAVRFRSQNATLRKVTEKHVANLSYPALGSFFRPISSEGRGLDGKRVYYAAIDELHEHPSSIVLDKMRAGTKGWPDPLIFMITNSGYDRESVCWHQHEYSRKVVEGTLPNDAHFAFVCGLDEGDDWMNDQSCWRKANPNLGVSISERYLAELVDEARAIPSKRNIVARLNFCVWTQQATRWIQLEDWDQCRVEVEEEELIGRTCYGGLDLATRIDIAAWVMVFPPRGEQDRWLLLPRFFLPEDGITARALRDGVPYETWADEGYIQVTPGNVTDYDAISARIRADAENYDVREIAVDPWNSTQITTQLTAMGLTVTQFVQGYAAMNAPAKEFERLVLSHQLGHDGHPVLRWMAGNATVLQDQYGNIKPDKSRRADKIDGIVAAIMAIGRACAMTDDDAMPGIVVI